jgi:hypothetical protein
VFPTPVEAFDLPPLLFVAPTGSVGLEHPVRDDRPYREQCEPDQKASPRRNRPGPEQRERRVARPTAEKARAALDVGEETTEEGEADGKGDQQNDPLRKRDSRGRGRDLIMTVESVD